MVLKWSSFCGMTSELHWHDILEGLFQRGVKPLVVQVEFRFRPVNLGVV